MSWPASTALSPSDLLLASGVEGGVIFAVFIVVILLAIVFSAVKRSEHADRIRAHLRSLGLQDVSIDRTYGSKSHCTYAVVWRDGTGSTVSGSCTFTTSGSMHWSADGAVPTAASRPAPPTAATVPPPAAAAAPADTLPLAGETLAQMRQDLAVLCVEQAHLRERLERLEAR